MTMKIDAQFRTEIGKNAARKLRHKGYIPGVVYSPHIQPMHVAVNIHQIEKILTGGGHRTIVDLHIKKEDDAVEKHQVLFKQIQRHPVSGRLLHIDFYHVVPGEKILVTVPVHLEGEAYGIREQAGALQFLTRRVKIKCLPSDLPPFVPVNIEHLKVGQSVAFKDLPGNPKIDIQEDPEKVIVSIISVRGSKKAQQAEENVEESS